MAVVKGCKREAEQIARRACATEPDWPLDACLDAVLPAIQKRVCAKSVKPRRAAMSVPAHAPIGSGFLPRTRQPEDADYAEAAAKIRAAHEAVLAERYRLDTTAGQKRWVDERLTDWQTHQHVTTGVWPKPYEIDRKRAQLFKRTRDPKTDRKPVGWQQALETCHAEANEALGHRSDYAGLDCMAREMGGMDAVERAGVPVTLGGLVPARFGRKAWESPTGQFQIVSAQGEAYFKPSEVRSLSPEARRWFRKSAPGALRSSVPDLKWADLAAQVKARGGRMGEDEGQAWLAFSDADADFAMYVGQPAPPDPGEPPPKYLADTDPNRPRWAHTPEYREWENKAALRERWAKGMGESRNQEALTGLRDAFGAGAGTPVAPAASAETDRFLSKALPALGCRSWAVKQEQMGVWTAPDGRRYAYDGSNMHSSPDGVPGGDWRVAPMDGVNDYQERELLKLAAEGGAPDFPGFFDRLRAGVKATASVDAKGLSALLKRLPGMKGSVTLRADGGPLHVCNQDNPQVCLPVAGSRTEGTAVFKLPTGRLKNAITGARGEVRLGMDGVLVLDRMDGLSALIAAVK